MTACLLQFKYDTRITCWKKFPYIKNLLTLIHRITKNIYNYLSLSILMRGISMT